MDTSAIPTVRLLTTSKLSLAIPQPLWEDASTLTLPHSQPQFGKASEKSMHVPLVGIELSSHHRLGDCFVKLG